MSQPETTRSGAALTQDSAAPSVLWKAFDVLGVFSQHRRVLTLAQIARFSGLPKSTVHRILAMLIAVGAVEPHGDGYRMGLRMFAMGSLVKEAALRDIALPHMEELHRLTGQTLHLAILSGDEVIYLEKLRARNASATPAVVGGRLPAHCTAVGKALLAYADPAVADAVLRGPLPGRTRATMTRPEAVRKDLDRVRREGVARDREEAVDGLACIAAPILIVEHAVAAVSVAFPAAAGTGDVLAKPLRQTATAVARAIAVAPGVDTLCPSMAAPPAAR
jgi:DNA-binding IclR family transcriptional regulator